MRAVVVVLLGALGAQVAMAAPAHDRAALQREVASAAAARDWCRALHYTEFLESLAHEPRLVFNAAELARAAGDLATALTYYQAVLDRDPDYAKAPLARRGLEDVRALIETSGPGARCAVAAPRCGDGAVEGREVCDDGNTASGDACTADCMRAPRCGDGHLDRNEMCDDGNNVDGDHCSATCLPEAAGTPRPEPDPEPEEPARVPEGLVIHETRDEPAPPPEVAVTVLSERPPDTTGSAMVGMSVIGGGVVVAVTGLVCAVVGPLPLLGYLSDAAVLDASDEGARQSRTAQRYTLAVEETGRIERDMRVSMEQWNGTGRVVAGAGLTLALLGTGAIIAGSVLYRNATPEEPAVGVGP